MKQQKNILMNVMIRLLFAVYVYILFKVILFKFAPIQPNFLLWQLKASLENPGFISSRLHEGNLTPFREISRTLHELTTNGLINLVGNVAIFVPYGILLGFMMNNRRISSAEAFLRALGLSFGLSFCLECSQVVFSIGRFDVDDLILNTAGGLIGWLAFKSCKEFVAILTSILHAKERPVLREE